MRLRNAKQIIALLIHSNLIGFNPIIPYEIYLHNKKARICEPILLFDVVRS